MRKQQFICSEGISIHKHKMLSCSGSSRRIKTFKWSWGENLSYADVTGNSLPASFQLNNPGSSFSMPTRTFFPLEIHHQFHYIRIQHTQTCQTLIQTHWCVRNPSNTGQNQKQDKQTRLGCTENNSGSKDQKLQTSLLFRRALPLQHFRSTYKAKTKTF